MVRLCTIGLVLFVLAVSGCRGEATASNIARQYVEHPTQVLAISTYAVTRFTGQMATATAASTATPSLVPSSSPTYTSAPTHTSTVTPTLTPRPTSTPTVTPSPTPRYREVTLFKETFSNNRNGWFVGSYANHRQWFDSDGYHSDGTKATCTFVIGPESASPVKLPARTVGLVYEIEVTKISGEAGEKAPDLPTLDGCVGEAS